MITLVVMVSSCITTKKVLKKTSSEIAGTHTAEIVGRYKNVRTTDNPDSLETKETLWWQLKWLDARLLGSDTLKSYSVDAVVELKYFEPYMYASVYEEGVFQEEIRYKVKIQDDFVKAYTLKVIPFAPFFFLSKERCLLITKRNNELIIRHAADEFAMALLMTHGYDYSGKHVYQSISDEKHSN